MNIPDEPKKVLLIITAVCAVILTLAVVIGIMAKNSDSAAGYVLEEDQVSK